MLLTESFTVPIEVELANLADIVINRRPLPERTYDQIYMMNGDMINQARLIQNHIADKQVVFLGDGDGMSMLFGLLAVKNFIKVPRSIRVLDFDERIINNINNFSKDYGFTQYFAVDTMVYNVISPIPQQFKGQSDFFYINPPYGSKNNGISTDVWLHRCMDLCMDACSGCIIIPYDNDQEWTKKAMKHVQRFLTDNGFVIKNMLSFLHKYHLKDNPSLKSACIIVDRIETLHSEYSSSDLPKSMLANLYGSSRPIPKCIRDDGTLYGTPDFNWEYGDANNLN